MLHINAGINFWLYCAAGKSVHGCSEKSQNLHEPFPVFDAKLKPTLSCPTCKFTTGRSFCPKGLLQLKSCGTSCFCPVSFVVGCFLYLFESLRCTIANSSHRVTNTSGKMKMFWTFVSHSILQILRDAPAGHWCGLKYFPLPIMGVHCYVNETPVDHKYMQLNLCEKRRRRHQSCGNLSTSSIEVFVLLQDGVSGKT